MNRGIRLFGRYRVAGAMAVCLVACIGCGEQLATVEGTVTFDGEPVESGSITFEPADGDGPTDGGKIENGQYKLAGEAGVEPGEKVVRIVASRKTGRQVDAGMGMPGAKGEGGPSSSANMVDEYESYIPAKYNEKSELTREIVAGKNTHDFELQSQ